MYLFDLRYPHTKITCIILRCMLLLIAEQKHCAIMICIQLLRVFLIQICRWIMQLIGSYHDGFIFLFMLLCVINRDVQVRCTSLVYKFMIMPEDSTPLSDRQIFRHLTCHSCYYYAPWSFVVMCHTYLWILMVFWSLTLLFIHECIRESLHLVIATEY